MAGTRADILGLGFPPFVSPYYYILRRPSYVVQELGREVGAVGPLDGVASETILDELVAVEQLAEHLARQVGLQVAELARAVAEGEQQLVVLHIIYIGNFKHICVLLLF